jgi:hypothetical protein
VQQRLRERLLAEHADLGATHSAGPPFVARSADAARSARARGKGCGRRTWGLSARVFVRRSKKLAAAVAGVQAGARRVRRSLELHAAGRDAGREEALAACGPAPRPAPSPVAGVARPL